MRAHARRVSAAISPLLLLLMACGDDGGTTDSGTGMDAATDSTTGDTGSADTAVDARECGPSPCGACLPGCTANDQCVDGMWSCECICPDASMPDGGADAAADANLDAAADAGPGPDAMVCASAQLVAADFLAANKSCSADEDCVVAPAACFGAEEACCAVYMADGYDTTAWTAILDTLMTCAGGGCVCCRALPPPPGCNAGTCGPRGARP